MDTHEQINADRLTLAADAVLRAVLEVARERGGASPYPPDLMGSPDQPQCLVEFTHYEIEQATDFLMRLGFLSTTGDDLLD